jgi:hypothetical protein
MDFDPSIEDEGWISVRLANQPLVELVKFFVPELLACGIYLHTITASSRSQP